MKYEIFDKKVVLKINDEICKDSKELIGSNLFKEVLNHLFKKLERKESFYLKLFDFDNTEDNLILLFKELSENSLEDCAQKYPFAKQILENKILFKDFVEYLYNYWRNFERFMICESASNDIDKTPYKTFNNTIEYLTQLIRKTYRDIEENILHKRPRTYRQIKAGADFVAIVKKNTLKLAGESYQKLANIPFIRQVLFYPPLILDPPLNKRSGKFEKITSNPLDSIGINEDDWLAYPAKIGKQLIIIYFHKSFYELGFSICNLFELAEDEELDRKPDAIYLFGADADQLLKFTDNKPTVFYDDETEKILTAFVCRGDAFAYFGYLKKMVLTLHNIKIIKEKKFPFHGALIKIILSNGIAKNVLLIGDTGTGKSETIEALREVGSDTIQSLQTIADDMGSVEIENGEIIGYGTEIGAFLRLDDLRPDYAFGQLDRAIIMSPSKVNARIIMPVCEFENVIKGHKLDYIFYANNYEKIDEERPVIEKFNDIDLALDVFRQGAAMSKGTTTATGITHSYFANVFGPVQYKQEHELIARDFFKAFFDKGLFVGQIRTRLGIPGFETKGAELAASELLNLINQA